LGRLPLALEQRLSDLGFERPDVRPTDGWAMPRSAAAALKPPSSTTLLKTVRRRGLAEIIEPPM
jgi:hypothetical protein